MRARANSASTTCCSRRKQTAKASTIQPEFPSSIITARSAVNTIPSNRAMGIGQLNLFRPTGSAECRKKFLWVADWLVLHLEQTRKDSRSGITTSTGSIATLRAPWYLAVAQGQGTSVLVRAHRQSGDARYLDAAHRASASFLQPLAEGGVTFTDEQGYLWFEYIVSPPTHILPASSGQPGAFTTIPGNPGSFCEGTLRPCRQHPNP